MWVRTAACTALLLLSPLLGSVLTLTWSGHRLADYSPTAPNDEILHYLEARAFATHGWRAGQFGVAEKPARASWSPFGMYGPGFAAVYGTLMRWTGTGVTAGPVLNVAWVTLALAVYFALTRPANRTTLFLAAFIFSYWPLYAWVFSWMQEAFHMAVAVLVAGLFIAHLREPFGRRRLLLGSVTVGVLIAASAVRVSWALLLPVACFTACGRDWRRGLSAIIAGCVLVLLCLKMSAWLCSPFPLHRDAFLMNKVIDGDSSLADLGANVRYNVTLGFGSYFGSTLSTGVLIACLAVPVVSVLVACRSPGARSWAMVVGSGVALVLLASIVVYKVTVSDAPRLIAVYLLLSLLIAAQAPDKLLQLLLPCVMVYNLATIGPSLDTVSWRYAAPFDRQPERIARFVTSVAGKIVFDPAGDRWANTVLTDRLAPELAGLPEGIGVVFFFRARDIEGGLKSRYVICTPDIAAKLGLERYADLPSLQGRLADDPAPLNFGLWVKKRPERGDR